MTDTMIFIAIVASVVMACLGFVLGASVTDAYWVDHGENGGTVYHKGKFYTVKRAGGGSGELG